MMICLNQMNVTIADIRIAFADMEFQVGDLVRFKDTDSFKKTYPNEYIIKSFGGDDIVRLDLGLRFNGFFNSRLELVGPRETFYK